MISAVEDSRQWLISCLCKVDWEAGWAGMLLKEGSLAASRTAARNCPSAGTNLERVVQPQAPDCLLLPRFPDARLFWGNGVSSEPLESDLVAGLEVPSWMEG